MSDWDLLREYVDAGSEKAFSELVGRHLDMVYSVAFRRLNDAGAAQEAAQSVFCLLAEKARQIPSGAQLGGWLYQTACFKSAEFARKEHRRREREKEVSGMELSDPNTEADAAWKQMASLLDDAVRDLNEPDRQAVVLRFFERKSLRDVGLALRLDEDAARKRVSRAVDKLRSWFAKKGVSCSTSVLTAALLTNAVQTAPAGAASLLIKAALTSAAVSAASVAPPIVSNLLKIMIAKKIIVIAAVVAVSIPTAVLWKQNNELRAELDSLRPLAGEAERLRAANTALTASQIDTNELARLKAGQTELLRLRGQLALARKQPAVASERKLEKTPEAAPGESTNSARAFNTSIKAHIPEGKTLAIGGWPHEPGKRAIALVSHQLDSSSDKAAIIISTTLVEMPDAVWDRLGLAGPNAGNDQNQFESVLDGEQAANFINSLTNNEGVNILSRPRVSTTTGVPATIYTGNGGDSGQSISMRPTIAADSKDLHLSMDLELTSPASATNGMPQSGGN